MSKTGVKVELIGHDGNAFAILGKVKREMGRAGVAKAVIDEYMAEATAGDYDNLLAVTMAYVEVDGVDDPDAGPCVCGSYDHPTEDHPTDEPGEYLEPDEAPEVRQ